MIYYHRHFDVWLDTPRKVRSVGEHELEFTDDPVGGRRD